MKNVLRDRTEDRKYLIVTNLLKNTIKIKQQIRSHQGNQHESRNQQEKFHWTGKITNLYFHVKENIQNMESMSQKDCEHHNGWMGGKIEAPNQVSLQLHSQGNTK